MQSTAVIIVSNHRTGSGCLSSILHTLGVPMIPTPSPTMTGDDAWEDQDFVKMHRAILSEIVGPGYNPITWRYPVPQFDEKTVSIYRQTLMEKSKRPLWGFKDPRTVWLLEFVIGMTAGLGIDARFVWLKRRTAAVAASLRTRDQARWPADHNSVAVHQRSEWDRMYSRFFHAMPGVEVSYEELVAEPSATIARVAELLPVEVSQETLAAAASIVKPR